MDALNALLAKFAQPSSWGGLAALLALVGFNVSDNTASTIAQFGAAACGLLAIVINERTHKLPPQS